MKIIKFVLFWLGFVGICLFYRWAEIVWVSFVFLVTLDYITLKWLRSKIARILPQKLKQIVKYGYYIGLVLGLAIFIRTFIIDIYYVPSRSMERTLFPGDYVLVNKLAYGVKLPQKLVEIPIIGSFFKEKDMSSDDDSSPRLKGYKKFQREDIVLFKSITENNKFLIKRVIGLPGEEVELKSSQVFINKHLLPDLNTYTYTYQNSKSDIVNEKYNLSNAELDTSKNKQFLVRSKAKKNFYENSLFPFSIEYNWTRDDYGPVLIPKKGLRVIITKSNIALYQSILIRFEGVNFKEIQYNKTYTFKNDYYFILGDNRHLSQDSRYFGFIPESQALGKLIWIY